MAGLSSGIAVERKWWQLADNRDGLISYVENYDDEATARKAAGVERSLTAR